MIFDINRCLQILFLTVFVVAARRRRRRDERRHGLLFEARRADLEASRRADDLASSFARVASIFADVRRLDVANDERSGARAMILRLADVVVGDGQSPAVFSPLDHRTSAAYVARSRPRHLAINHGRHPKAARRHVDRNCGERKNVIFARKVIIIRENDGPRGAGGKFAYCRRGLPFSNNIAVLQTATAATDTPQPPWSVPPCSILGVAPREKSQCSRRQADFLQFSCTHTEE